MGNVTLPTPVFIAGGAFCLLAGYLAGAVLSPDPPDRTTATVATYDTASNQLCLSGKSVENRTDLNSDKQLCGTWRRTPGSVVPSKGDRFRYVAVRTTGQSNGQTRHQTVIYGDVVGQ